MWLRFRYRDLDALETRALRARKAFRDGKPRTASPPAGEQLLAGRGAVPLRPHPQLPDERLAAKPLKLLQEYEFYTIRRLERTRILVRVGPMLGLMGTLIPLAPALVGLASGDVAALSENLVTAFSVTVIGLLIGGLAFLVSIVRDRLYSQDISDMEYLLELLEGSDVRLRSGRRLSKTGIWDTEAPVEYEVADEDAESVKVATLPETPDEPLLPVAAGAGTPAEALAPVAAGPAHKPAGGTDEAAGLTFDDPTMDWSREEDPFANLGPVDPEGTDDPRPPRGRRPVPSPLSGHALERRPLPPSEPRHRHGRAGERPALHAPAPSGSRRPQR